MALHEYLLLTIVLVLVSVSKIFNAGVPSHLTNQMKKLALATILGIFAFFSIFVCGRGSVIEQTKQSKQAIRQEK